MSSLKSALKSKLEGGVILKVYHFFRYGFIKNCKALYKKIRSEIYKFYMFRIMFPRAYKKNAKLPIDEKKIVFIELRLPTLTNSFKLIYDELVSNYDFKVHTHFLRTTFVNRKDYHQRCKDMMADIATAKYVFLNEASNVVSCVKMRPETIVTQTWHGCGAFKKFGMSTADLIFGASRKEMLRYPFNKNYTYVTISSPEVKWAYEEAMNLQGQSDVIIPIGSSRTDVFYDEAFRERAMKKLHMLMPSSEGKKVILYAPTFRGRVAKAQTPQMLNVQMFAEALSEEYVLLFKHHPLVRKPPAVPALYRDFALDMTEAMSIEELLSISDICISDYSSLVFEYSLYERPLIFFSYDLSEYFDWRGFYYDYYELAPGPVLTTNREMIDYIQHVDERFDRERVVAFRNKFMSSCDGHVTERLMKQVFGEALEQNRRENPEPDEYHMIPHADNTLGMQQARLNELKLYKNQGARMYEKACQRPINDKKIVVFASDKDKAAIRAVWAPLEKAGFQMHTVELQAKKLKEAVDTIADAAVILLADSNDFINALKLRKETKLIQLWEEILPLRKFGYASKEYRGNFYKEYTEIAPLHGRYDLVPITSDKLKNIFAEAFRVEPDCCQAMGSVETDLLFDKAFAQKAKEKLLELFPGAEGKKVIFYEPKNRMDIMKSTRQMFINYVLMNEYLKDEYVIVYSTEGKSKEKNSLYPYHAEFIRDMTESMTVYELMAASDLMIGDYRPEVYTYAVTDKPILIYAPDYKWYYEESNMYFSYEELVPGPIYTDNQELIDALRNMEQYDATKQRNFKETYMNGCDGHSTDRLVEYILQK